VLFREASKVTPINASEYQAALAPNWDIAGVVDGGYTLAVAGRALQHRTGRDPVSVTAHYLSPGRTGPLTVATDIIKAGSRFTTGSALVRQDDRPVMALLGSFGEYPEQDDVLRRDDQPPSLPPPDDLPRVRHQPGAPFPPPFMERIDVRLSPDDSGFFDGRPSGEPRMRGYWRLLDHEPCDAIALLLAADSLPPTTFNSGLAIAWTPTLELTVHVRSVPVPGWLRLDFRTRAISHGRLEVDGLIWDASDRLVAMSRQLMLVPAG
jgi:acyl-CoA thioesterase